MPRDLIITLVEWMGIIAVTMILAISPAFQRRRPVKFVYPRREVLVSLGLVALSAVILVVMFSLIPFAPASTLDAGQSAGAGFSFTFSNLFQELELALAIAAPFLLALAIRRQPWLSAGLGKSTWRASLSMGLALAIMAIFLRGKINVIISGLSASSWIYLLAMLALALAEEFVFRGFIQLRLVGWLGETWGWVSTAVLYTLWNLPQKLLVEHASLPDLALNLATLLAFGLVLGWIMRKSGNVLAPGLYHAVHNWLAVL